MQQNRRALRRRREVVGEARTPYAAAVALEAWFRQRRSAGSSTTSAAACRSANEPALASFVTRTKRGYCQHFAGAMALMLRYLGIPARVAAGFTSGSYDAAFARVDGDRPRGARLGRGLLPGLGLDPVRPDARPRHARTRATPSTSPEFFDTRRRQRRSLRAGGASQSTRSSPGGARTGRPGLEGSSGIGNSRGGGVVVTIVRDKGPSIVASPSSSSRRPPSARHRAEDRCAARSASPDGIRATSPPPAGATSIGFSPTRAWSVPPSATLARARQSSWSATSQSTPARSCARRRLPASGRPTRPGSSSSAPGASCGASGRDMPQPHQHDEPRPRRAQPPLAGRLNARCTRSSWRRARGAACAP